MTPLEEVTQLAIEKTRRLFVAENPIDLSITGENCVYVLELSSSGPGSAGGRIGGIGERKIQKAYCFRQTRERWLKVYETDAAEKLGRFSLPYHAAGLSVILPDKTERVVSGVVDPELVDEYNHIV